MSSFCLENWFFLNCLKKWKFVKISLEKSKFFVELPEKNWKFSEMCLEKSKFCWPGSTPPRFQTRLTPLIRLVPADTAATGTSGRIRCSSLWESSHIDDCHSSINAVATKLNTEMKWCAQRHNVGQCINLKQCGWPRSYNPIQYCIVLYLSVSIALLTAWAFQKRSRPQQLTLSEFTCRSATGNCKWRTCPRSLHGG